MNRGQSSHSYQTPRLIASVVIAAAGCLLGIVHLAAAQGASAAPADTSAAKAVKDSAAPARGAVVVEEEDIFSEMSKQGLRLDGAEASILSKPKTTVVPVDTARPSSDTAKAAAALPVDSSAVIGSPSQAPQPGPYDKRGRYGKYGPPSEGMAPPVEQVGGPATKSTDTMVIGPGKVESVRSVNFARNLKEYRSPKLAMLLSLILPGVGQAYAHCAWRSVVYGVIEAAVIGLGVTYTVKGGNERDAARAHARKHYDPDGTRFLEYYDSLESYLENVAVADTLFNPSEVLSYYFYFYHDDSSQTFKDYYRGQRDHKSEAYYSWIGGTSFVHGWDDATPDYMEMFGATPTQLFALGDTTTYTINPHTFTLQGGSTVTDSAFMLIGVSGEHVGKRTFGYSEHQADYLQMLSTSSKYYNIGSNVLFVLLLNHVASAVDAGITAKRYNDKMLGKQSMWDRVHIEQAFVNTGTEFAPSVALRLDF